MKSTKPPKSPKSPKSPNCPKHNARGKTRFAKRVNFFLRQFIDPINVIGNQLFGEWWKPFVSSIQDAFAIGCLTWIPNLIFRFFSSGRDFSTLDNCLEIGITDPSSFACLGIVVSEYSFWILFLSRTAARFFHQLNLNRTQ